MKKLLTALLLATTSFASFAGGYHGGGHHGHGYRHHGYHSYNWVAPAVIGGLLVYGATRPYYYYSEPVYTPPAQYLGPVVVNQVTPVAYWCAQGDGYFPQVQSCSDWQVVTK